ncbi:MAG: hypothetical protein IKQ99_01300 [Alphaproteobacteria bacterium]|nr:hypothetical protein [Alphaproteobacteria bacterium]
MKKIFITLFFLMAGCGFSPLYNETLTKEGSAPVAVNPIPNQYGVSMRQRILSKIGISKHPLYTLSVSAPSFSANDQTIDSRNFATMMAISGSTSYSLVDNKTQKTVLKSSASAFSSYSVTKDPYATVTAKRKAQKELAEQLAEQISQHVLVVLPKESDESKTVSN